jgi:hypothetical protein
VRRYLLGWVLVVIAYLLTFLVSANLGAVLSSDSTFLHNFVAGCMLVVPYIVSGAYVKRTFANTQMGAVWVSFVPVVCERALIFAIGMYYASERLLPGWNGLTVINFVQAKTPAFYFSLPYVCLGVVSVLISVVTAGLKKTE